MKGKLAAVSLMLALMAGLSAAWSGYNPFFWGTVTWTVCIIIFAAMLVVVDESPSRRSN